MKKVLTLLFLAVLCHNLNAQELITNWETLLTNMSGSNYEDLVEIQGLTQGFLVGGSSSQSMGIDMYIARYDGNQQLIWERTIDSPESSSIRQMFIDDQENIYWIGKETGGVLDKLYLGKFDGNGDPIWQVKYPGFSGGEVNLAEAIISETNIYICGNVEFPDFSMYGWLAKFDLEGNLIWDTNFDPGIENAFADLTMDSQGNIIVSGSADFGYAALGVKYDNDGNLIWSFPDNLSGFSEQWFTDVIVDKDDNLFFTGTVESGYFFQYDVFTQKRDPNGNLLWEKNFSNGSENYSSTLLLGSDGSVYSAFNSSVDFNFSFRLIKYNSSGTQLFSKTYQIDSGTSIIDAELDGDDNLFAVLQGFDAFGFLKYSPGGSLLAETEYPQNGFNIRYVSDLEISDDAILGLTVFDDNTQNTIFSLDASDLSENFELPSFGEAQSDVRPNAVISDEVNSWVSSVYDNNETVGFTISNIDNSGNLNWERTVTQTDGIPEFRFLAQDKEHNIIGFYENLSTTGGEGIGLLKVDPSGNEVFHLFLNDEEMEAGGLVTDDENNIYIAGIRADSKKQFLAKYTPEGSQVWLEEYVSPSESFAFSEPLDMKITTQKKLVIVSSHKGENNDNDLHLFQYDLMGNLEWDRNIADVPGNSNSLAGFTVLELGQIYVFGQSGSGNYVAAGFDETGNKMWEDSGSTSTYGAPRSMTMDDAGNIFLCFSTNSHANIRKLDSNGEFLRDAQLSVASSGTFFIPSESFWIDGNLVLLGRHIIGTSSYPFQFVANENIELIYSQIDSSMRNSIASSFLRSDMSIIAAYQLGSATSTTGSKSGLIKSYSLRPAIPDNDQDGFGEDVDCDDENANVNPDQSEIPYNGLDDDCNPETLDDDLDEDGFGIAEDCDDTNAAINPDQTEIPYNGIDEDCNELTLDDDLDEDGFGIDEDCDDSNAAVNPDQTEIPYNGLDDDCNELTLDDDLDEDGFGIDEDCDDSNAAVNSNQTEIPYNGLDDDCNELTLDDDLDEDGFGIDEDCNDEDPNINPDAEDIANNGIDENCDGEDLVSSVLEINGKIIKIYPNPASEFLILEGLIGTFSAEIFDVSGSRIAQFQNRSVIHLNNIPEGLYFLKIQLDGQQDFRIAKFAVSK